MKRASEIMCLLLIFASFACGILGTAYVVIKDLIK